jgi:hypothetical protein
MASIYGSPKQTIIASGLQYYVNASITTSYPGSGTSWYDLSGNNRTTTLNNGASYSVVNNKPGIVFNGSNQYANASVSGIDSNTYTFISVFKRNGTQDGSSRARRLIELRDSPSVYFAISNGGTSNNKLTWEYSSNDYNVDTGLTTTDQTWQFAAITFTNTASNSIVNVYLNKQVFTYTIALYNYTTTTNNITLGGNGSNGFFNGTIGATLLYTRALSQAEILQNYYALNLTYLFS